MSYEFKVGDKGKTRDGSEYEVLLIDDRLGAHPIVSFISSPSIPLLVCHNKNGKSEPLWGRNLDLLPPKRKLTFYVNVYERKIDSHIFRHVAEECATPDALLVAQKAEFEV